MSNKSKIIVALFVFVPIFLVLGASYINSAKLINDFEETIEEKPTTPEAASIEVAEIDKLTKRSWKIKAKSSTSNADLTVVQGKDVEIFIYDENENEKVKISAANAEMNKNTNINTLTGNAVVTMANSPMKLKANKFVVVKGKPIEGTGNVQLWLNANGSNLVNASRVVIQESLDDMIFYGVARSPVSGDTLIQGGVLSFIQNGGRVSKYILSNGSWVQSGGTTCTSSRADFAVDGTGKVSMATFTGSPVAVQKGTTIRANVIQYQIASKKVKATGNVKTQVN
ncbi:MAG: LPS export ABC transporter periplasmic protein LptC [Candidatus Caenarcaniphilales bacterium]|nr:LPS export ABC transporter periplasmic protein LptC [Candidatus Caenarcaniphilales bacterium]